MTGPRAVAAPQAPVGGQVESDLDRRVVRGSAWLALSHGGHTVAWMVTLFVLARILDPADFGITSIAGTILLLGGYVQQAGTGAALVQRRTDLREAAASALLFNLVTGLAFYALVFVLAPVAASFFGAPELEDVIRVLAIAVAVRSIAWIGVALLERELRFARAASAEIAAAVVEMTVAIGFAVGGAGVWSIVFGQLAGALVQVGVTWALVTRRPSLRDANLRVTRELFSFGKFVSAGHLLVFVAASIDNLFVGRILGATALGYYALAYRLAAIPGAVLGVIAERVTLPAYSMLVSDRSAFKRAYLANLQRLSFLTLPLGVGLIVAAEPLVVGLLGARWEPAVEPLRLLAVFGVLESLAGSTAAVFQAAGRPQLLPLTTLLGLAALLPLLWILTSRHGTTGAALAMILGLTPVAAVRIALAARIVGAAPVDVARALWPPGLCAALLAAALIGLTAATAELAAGATLAVLVVGGAAAYALAARLFAPSVLHPIVAGFRRSTT
ncbi:MAG TPA: lipopolysaccharide biosynthesis protein [Gaiellaceae bacterium]|nr:lipopolysaccharide biosynthesis protein [Gaiellaceae bacterium]